MAPTVKIDNPSSHNYSLTGNASHYPVQMPNVPSIVFHAQELRLPLTLPQQQQHETTQNQGLTMENENEITRQKLEMLSRYMKTIKEKKNVHLMSICIKTFELSVQNRKIQMELDELREQTKKFLEELKANSMTSNLKTPMSKDLSQQLIRTNPLSINTGDMVSPLLHTKLPYPNATQSILMNAPNVNNLYSFHNPSQFNPSNFQNTRMMMPPTTMSSPVSTFPLEPSSIHRDGEIEKRIQIAKAQELHRRSIFPCYESSTTASNQKVQSPRDNSSIDDEEDSSSNSTSSTEIENGDIPKTSVPTRREGDKRINNEKTSHQLQQRKTRGKISSHILKNDMSKYLDLISRKPIRKTRRGSISSASSTNISLDMKKKQSLSKQNRMRCKTLLSRPSSSSSFSSCSDLNLSQCSSPVSPFFSSSNWSTTDEFEDITDTDMNERHNMRIEI